MHNDKSERFCSIIGTLSFFGHQLIIKSDFKCFVLFDKDGSILDLLKCALSAVRSDLTDFADTGAVKPLYQKSRFPCVPVFAWCKAFGSASVAQTVPNDLCQANAGARGECAAEKNLDLCL